MIFINTGMEFRCGKCGKHFVGYSRRGWEGDRLISEDVLWEGKGCECGVKYTLFDDCWNCPKNNVLVFDEMSL
jgi:hypothetical protein